MQCFLFFGRGQFAPFDRDFGKPCLLSVIAVRGRGIAVIKLSRTMALSVLMVLFLVVSLCYGQGAAEKSYNKGVEYAVQGKFEKAKQEFERALKVDPSYAPARMSFRVIEDVIDQKIKSEAAIHLFKGTGYGNKGRLDEEISEYNKALKINPRYAMAYLTRGLTYAKGKGQYDRAVSDFDKAIELNPRLAEAYNNRGNAYTAKGQYDQAISDYNRAIEIYPRYDAAYYNRGLAYAKGKGQYDRAISDFDKAIELNPRLAEAYYNRGLSYYFKREYDKAWDDVHKAQALGYQIHPGFLKALRKASGRQK